MELEKVYKLDQDKSLHVESIKIVNPQEFHIDKIKDIKVLEYFKYVNQKIYPFQPQSEIRNNKLTLPLINRVNSTSDKNKQYQLKNDIKISLQRTLINKRIIGANNKKIFGNNGEKIVRNDDKSQQNSKNGLIKPSKSVLVNRYPTPIDQSYLPAFIKNFKLPQKPLLKIKKTCQCLKSRQILLRPHLSSAQILKKYKMISQIGKGSFSIVSLAMQEVTFKKFAIKTYVKFDQMRDDKFQNIIRQVINLRRVKHHNVCEIIHLILDKRKLHLVMEYCGQLTLAGVLKNNKKHQQSFVKKYFRQILNAVQYIHSNNVCHRDLKLQNIIIDEKDQAKVIDFGFSTDTNRQLNIFCGTVPYMAPQIIQRTLYNGKQTDIWSLGVILYNCIYGQFPFKSTNQPQLFRLIQQGKFHHNDTSSQQVKQLINKMLKLKPCQRLTASQLLRCQWFKQ